MARDVRYQILIDGKPDAGLTAEATEITVTESIEAPTTFQLRFATDVCDGDMAFMDDDRVKPSGADTLVSVVVVVNGETSCIAHGIVTRRRGSFVEGGPGSWLEITCSDRRAVMDREQRVDHHSGKASETVRKILDSYSFELDVEETTVEYREDAQDPRPGDHRSRFRHHPGGPERLLLLGGFRARATTRAAGGFRCRRGLRPSRRSPISSHPHHDPKTSRSSHRPRSWLPTTPRR